MPPTRRALLATLASGSLAFCGCLAPSGETRDPAETVTATTTSGQSDTPTTSASPRVVLEPVEPERIAETATVAVVGDLAAGIRTAADGGDARFRLPSGIPLSAFDCVTHDGTEYVVATRLVEGAYSAEYAVERVEDPGDRDVVDVATLSESRRESVVAIIERGHHSYDSIEDGFQPRSMAYRYDGTVYVLENTLVADHPPLTVLSLSETADADSCLGVERFDPRVDRIIGEYVDARDTEFPLAVQDRIAADVREYDYLLSKRHALAVRIRR